MILVVGATGLLGSKICTLLRQRGDNVRALVRPGSPGAAKIADLGVEIVHGDLRRPADLEAACRGATAIISTATAMGAKDKSLTLRAIDREGQLALVAAARRAGVAHFTFISLSPALPDSAPLVRYKREVEAAIRASGMHWTILQPTVFMEIWLGPALGWDAEQARASIFGSGDGPLPWISADNVAEYAVLSTADARLRDRNIPLGGPEGLSPNKVLGIFERVSGRPFTVKRIPVGLLSMLAPVVGLFDEAAASGMRLGKAGAAGESIDSPLQRELGLPLTTVEQYVERVARRR